MGLKIKKNGRIINLSESDLRRITMKVLREQDEAEVATTDDGSGIEAELDEIDEDNPDPGKLKTIFDKLERFMEKGLPKKLERFKRKIKKMFTKHGNPKTHKYLGTACPKW